MTCGWVGHDDPNAWCNRRVSVRGALKWCLRLYVAQMVLGLVVGAVLPWLKLYGVW